MAVFTTACIGILLNVIYFLALDGFVPQAYRAYYCNQKKDLVSLVAVTLYHGIWIAWLLGGMPPAASGNAIAGTAAFLMGATLAVWAQKSNPYFAPTVIQPWEVIESGPYRFSNHPGYMGFGLMSAGMLVITGTIGGAICACVYWSILLLRSLEEDKLLRRR